MSTTTARDVGSTTTTRSMPKLQPINVNNLVNVISNKQLAKAFAVVNAKNVNNNYKVEKSRLAES